jgi:uncharacterized damage-inducible protein DinB
MARRDWILSINSAKQPETGRRRSEKLNDSLVYCDRVYAAITDANFIQPMQIANVGGTGSTKTVRGAMLTYNITHNNEHYDNLAVYMRLKGHVPPSTARAQQRRNQ